jgi:acyl-CoA synthetase (AMP-forming)/AMP-acid ligase II
MGPGYFVIAILGCADGGTTCTPVATLQTRYESEAQCSAATTGALEANTDFDFPTLVARCRPEKAAASAQADRAKPVAARFRRG